VAQLSDSDDLSSISDIDSVSGDDAKQPVPAKKQRKDESDDDNNNEDAPDAKRNAEAASWSDRGHDTTPSNVIVLDDTASSEDAGSISESENDSSDDNDSSGDSDARSDRHPSSSSDLPATSSRGEHRPGPEPLPPPPVIADDLEFDDALDALGSEPKSHRLWPSLAGFHRLVTRWQPDSTAAPSKPLREPPILGNFPPSAGTTQVALRFAR
jgi:hypothetical protein